MNNKKIYSYTTVVFSIIFFSVIFAGMLITIVLFPQQAWFLIIPMFVLLLSGWYAISVGILYPIYLSERGIKYRGKEYNWNIIKITAFSVPNRGYIESYLLFFGEKYFDVKEIKNEKRKGFYVYLKEKPLLEILKYYKNEIKILGIENQINSTRKINTIITEHNKKYWVLFCSNRYGWIIIPIKSNVEDLRRNF